MTMSYLLAQILNGLILGSVYALVAIGFTMIYGIVRLINFAQGDILTIGAFTAIGCVATIALPFPLLVLVVLAVGAAVGIVIERAAFRPMRGAPQVTGFIASLAVSIILENLAVMTITAQPRTFRGPAYLTHLFDVGTLSFSVIDLVIVLLSIVLMIGLVLFVRFTKVGIALRATAENYDVARLMGINIDRMIMMTFAIGCALSAIAGLMWAGKYGQVDPLTGVLPGLKAFVAAVIGGVGSIAGAVVGGYILGLAEVLVVGLLPSAYSGYRNAFVFGALIVVLLVMPNGILGRSTETRA